jgi:competence protein ComEA
LSGVGPATAQKIIDYRESNGRFSSVEDIKNVSGIGDKTYEKLKDSITI